MIAWLGLAIGAPAQSTVIGWGFNNNGQARAPLGLTTAVSVSAGSGASAALRANGTLVEWGFPLDPPMPPGLGGIMTFDCGRGHTLAVRSNGTVVAWGDNSSGQTVIPPGLSNVIAVAGGTGHSMALQADGTVVAWGDNTRGQSLVPPALSNVIAIAAGGNSFTAYSAALKSDGTVVAWGDNRQLQTTIPPGLSNVVAIATSPSLHSLALKSDGTVVPWGIGLQATNVPRGLSNVVAISAGSGYSLALRADGSVIAWGENFEGSTSVPATVRNVSAIASGWFHSVVVTHPARPPWPRIVEQPAGRLALIGRSVTLSVTATSTAPVSYQWQFRGRTIPGATDPTLRLDPLHGSDAGDYAVIATAAGLSVRSAPAFLMLTNPPIAMNVTATGREDAEVLITLNGLDPSDLPSVATLHSLPSGGQLHQFDAGLRGQRIETVPAAVTDPLWRLIYVPSSNSNGSPLDLFLFTVSNKLGDSDPARISIHLEPINDPPSFVGGVNQEIPEDAGPQVVPGWAAAIQAGPMNESSQSLTFLVDTDDHALFSAPPGVDANGTLRYTPAPDANGTATLVVRLQDDGGTENGGVDRSEPQFFTITITPLNDAPVAQSSAISLNEDAPIGITLGASDGDGDRLTFTVSPPAHGTLTGTPPALRYQPARDYHGADRFTFFVHDGHLPSPVAIVDLTILPLNDPPIPIAEAFSPTTLSSNESTHLVCVAADNTAALVILDGLRSTDVENDPLQFTWFETGRIDPIATGSRATNRFSLGRHAIVLQVTDRSEAATPLVPILVDVVTAGEVVDQIILELADNVGPRGNGRPIVASLKSAIASFDRGNVTAGLNQLQACQNKIRAQIGPTDPELSSALIAAIETLREVLVE